MVSKPWAVCTTPSQLQETGNLPGSQPSTHLEMHRNPSNGPHMAVPSTLNLTNHGPHLQTCGGLEQCQGSTVDGKCSNANKETNKIVSKQTVCRTPFQIHEKGNLLVSEPSMCVKMHKMIVSDHNHPINLISLDPEFL